MKTRKSAKGILPYIFSLLLFLSYNNISLKAQSSELEEVLDSAAIEEQFNYIFNRGSRYEEYKVIRENWLIRYRNSLTDTINGLRSKISNQEETISSKNDELDLLNTDLESTRDELKTAVKERNSLDILGLRMDKTFYNLIMWVVIAALAVVLILLFLMYKRSHTVTREAVAEAEKLKNDYEEYRTQSRLKVEKLKREHLDEILRLKGGK